MTETNLSQLLHTVREAHENNAALSAFCPFPSDLQEVEFRPYLATAAQHLPEIRGGLGATEGFAKTCLDFAPQMHWRESYRDQDNPPGFLESFGCFGIIGDRSPWHSHQMRAFCVLLPQNFVYPWHLHPAEELYFVLAGRGTFLQGNQAPKDLGQGEHVFHSANEPHALKTQDSPLLAYVLWRNALETLPVWTDAP